MTMAADADDLIALTERLAALIERDVTLLKGARPAALAQHDGERGALTALYGKTLASFKPKTAIATLPLDAQKRLKDSTERLHAALKQQARLLARFRHMTEGLVKAVAEAVAARDAVGTYGRSGAAVKPPAAPRASALTLNHSV